MQQAGAAPEPGELGYGAWIGFWVQLAILGLLVVLGALFASANRDPGDYACGITLSISAILLAFMRIKARFDGGPVDCEGFLLVDDVANLAAMVVVFVVLGLGGVFVAAGIGQGGLHVGGVALFVASAIGVLLSMKHVFDNLDHQH